MNPILKFFEWSTDSSIGDIIRKSIWLFPAIETVHIVALTVLFGAIVFVDLQMLGLIRRDTPVSTLAAELKPWTFCSLVVILVSGAMLFASEATKLYISTPFRFKVITLAVALIFHYTIHRKVTDTEDSRFRPTLGKLTAIVSIMLWLSVGLAGRAIGFF